jgi:ABC-2 type transport system permease protein
MTWILVRKLLRDARPALVAVCLVLFAFALFWVKITQRVTTEIAPMSQTLSTFAFGKKEVLEKLFVRGPSKVSQAALGWGEMNFDRPTDFLAIGLLHPIVLILCVVWGVGRAAGAVAGEIDRGTMELLMAQPVPRGRLILAHLLVDCVALPALCLSFFAGTQLGLALVGDFVPDYTMFEQTAREMGMGALAERLPRQTRPLPVEGRRELVGLVNTLALIFAISGVTVALSSVGRNRWRVVGLAALVVVVMFVANTVGQLWEPMRFARPFTFFFYYQPQRLMLENDWAVDLGKAWDFGRPVCVPGVGVLAAVGAAGYAFALYAFTRRDLPAPL